MRRIKTLFLTLLLVLGLSLVTGSTFLLVTPQIFNSYDRYSYNCNHFAYDIHKHYSRFGFDTRFMQNPNHIWVEVWYFGKWNRYEEGLVWYNAGLGREVSIERLMENKAYWELKGESNE